MFYKTLRNFLPTETKKCAQVFFLTAYSVRTIASVDVLQKRTKQREIIVLTSSCNFKYAEYIIERSGS